MTCPLITVISLNFQCKGLLAHFLHVPEHRRLHKGIRDGQKEALRITIVWREKRLCNQTVQLGDSVWE
jgi:hypothetical protein